MCHHESQCVSQYVSVQCSVSVSHWVSVSVLVSIYMSVSQCECQYECESKCLNVSVTLSVSITVVKLNLGLVPWRSPVGYFAKLHLGYLLVKFLLCFTKLIQGVASLGSSSIGYLSGKSL